MSSTQQYVQKKLFNHTSIFGLPFWVFVIFFIVLITVLILIVLCIFMILSRRRKPSSCLPINPALTAPNNYRNPYRRQLLSNGFSEIQLNISKPELQFMLSDEQWSTSRISAATGGRRIPADLEADSGFWTVAAVAAVLRGNRFRLTEIEMVTDGFSNENIIGNGDYGVVYRGILLNNTRVAVKRLHSDSFQGEREFITQVERIAQVRHKNLVKLLGYCLEGAYRILVYEYIDNGNLHQWIHGSVGLTKPLTWATRMNIIRGIAKGLAYLHEDMEPKIVHLGIKSTNILLDHQWNPKISDIGLTWLLGHESNCLATQASIMPGYEDRELASPGILNERDDVYSFGIHIMEIITGRIPLDHSQPQAYLVDWLKSMVANRKIVHVLDPKLPEIPNIKELKRIVLIALRCLDSDLKHRPKMGDVIHMFEPCDLLLNDNSWIRRNRQGENQPTDKSKREKITCIGNQKITPTAQVGL